MNILLACAGGLSTSIVAKKMTEISEEKGEKNKIWAVDVDSILSEITKQKVDIILLGPQLNFKLKSLQNELSQYNIPIYPINPIDYGMNRGANILDFVEEKLGIQN